MENSSDLFRLLDLDPDYKEQRQKLDSDAILKAVQQGPSSVDCTYYFPYGQNYPLHQAIMLRAPANVVKALCSPAALQQKGRVGYEHDASIAFHLALKYKSSLDIMKLLVQKQPDAVQEQTTNGDTPLHVACYYKSPIEIASLLVTSWPNALQTKGRYGLLPLHVACEYGSSLEVVSFLLDTSPDAVFEKGVNGDTPLHKACEKCASTEVISLLLDIWPDASHEKNKWGWTPLHKAFRNSASLEILLLLLDNWMEDTMEEHFSGGGVPFGFDQEHILLGDINLLLSYLCTVFQSELQNKLPLLNEIANFFINIAWWKGIRLLLDQYPTAISKSMNLDTNIMADFLSMIGRYCKLNTMWRVICNEQELLAYAY